MRIWVPRPEPGATRTGERLAAAGHRPLIAPVLVVRPTGAPLPAGMRFDAVLFTSANAVAALAATTEVGSLRGLPVFAVGGRTAGLALRARLGPVTEAGGDAPALATLVRETLAPGAHLLHVAGADRKAEPAASLTGAGYALTTLVAYAAEAVPALPDTVCAALSTDGLDGALHYSRRSASVALERAETAGYGGAFRALRHYCLSDDVAGPLEAAGVPVHFVATRPSEDELLAALR